jgi:hypothetical protein
MAQIDGYGSYFGCLQCGWILDQKAESRLLQRVPALPVVEEVRAA